jgi:hypothetical protein
MSAKIGLAAVVVVAAVGALVWITRGTAEPTSATASSSRTTMPTVPPGIGEGPIAATRPTGQVPGGPPRFRGLALQVQTDYQVVETFGPLLEEIADTGANTVLLTVAGFMEHAQSQALYIEQRKMPSREQFLTLLAKAKACKLQVLVMPIVLLANPRGTEWRGRIEPPDWAQWWEDYRQFIVYFADLAREGQAAGMTVGSELVTTESQLAQWTETIRTVRARFPEGVLGYSANWDTYDKVLFWDQLDFIGMTTYFDLADKGRVNPSAEEIMAKWTPIRARITQWQAGIHRPLVLTEIGWCSQEGAATEPWNYYHSQRSTPVGQEEQRRLYEAFMRTWDGTPEMLGVIWWEWTASPGGADDYGYTPKHKPAEAELRRWFAAMTTKEAGAARPPEGTAPNAPNAGRGG